MTNKTPDETKKLLITTTEEEQKQIKMVMDRAREEEKIKEIKKAFKERKIKRLGNGCYSIPSDFFVKGITPRMIKEVEDGN